MRRTYRQIWLCLCSHTICQLIPGCQLMGQRTKDLNPNTKKLTQIKQPPPTKLHPSINSSPCCQRCARIKIQVGHSWPSLLTHSGPLTPELLCYFSSTQKSDLHWRKCLSTHITTSAMNCELLVPPQDLLDGGCNHGLEKRIPL